MRRIAGRLTGIVLALLLAGCDGAGLETYPEPTPWPEAPPPGRDGCVPLSKATPPLTIPLGGGLGSDISPELLPNGRLLSLLNARQTRKGEISARTGTKALGTGLLGTTDTLPAPWKLGTLGGCLVSFSVVGDHPVNSWSPTAAQWATDSNAANAIKTRARGPIMAQPTRVSGAGHYPDLAYASGYYFVAYRSGSFALTGNETVREAIIDATTGKKVAEREFTDVSTVFNLGVRVVNGYAVFVRDTTANDLKFDAWQISNLDAGPTTTTFATTTGAALTETFDILVKDATTISVAYTDGTNIQAVDFVPSTATLTGWTPKDATAANIPVNKALNWMQDFAGSGKIALITSSIAQGLRVQWNFPTVGATRQAAVTYTIDAGAVASNNVVGHTTANSATGEFSVFYDLLVPGVTFAGGRIGGSVFSGSVIARSVIIRSKTWQQGSNYYMIGEFISTTQTTRYVLNVTDVSGTTQSPPLAMAQVRGGLGTGGGGGPAAVSAVVSPAANVWVSANTVQIRLQSNPVTYAPTDVGVELLRVSYQQPGDTTTGAPREAIGNLFVPGGILGQFDGTTYAEAGFAYYPETPSAPTLAGGGGLTPSSDYYWKFVYAYPDANGRLSRSADSIVLHVTAATLGANTKATFGIPTLRLVGRTDVRIEVYRGAANDSLTFQKVGSILNDPTVDTVSFADTMTDATLATQEFLYTNGGILANDPIPGFLATAVAGNRLWGISNDDGEAIWPSNTFVDGQGLRFSEQNKFAIRDGHGPLTALAAMPDGNVLAFKKDMTYVISGAGPDPLGRGTFSVSIISEDTGTTNPASILETSTGPMFQATTGRIYQVGRDLALSYIGAGVQQYAGESVIGTAMLATKAEARFYTPARALVHDLVTGTWSTDIISGGMFTATSATAYAGGAAFSTTDPLVIVDDFTVWTDNGGQSYFVFIETPWIQMTALRGFGRIYRVQGVGETAGAHTLTVGLLADLSGSTFAAGSVTPGALWDWELRYSKKLSALKVQLTWTATNGGGARASAIAIDYGVHQGMQHRPSGNRAT